MDKLSLHIGSEISLKDFSFSQLIIAVKNLFDTEGILYICVRAKSVHSI